MPQRKNVTLVACESCRKRKTRCDGKSPVCGPCQHRVAECVYSSDPGVSRLVALKSEHRQMKSGYDNLMRLYKRLKQGSASEVSALIERIKASDEILDMSEQDGRLPECHGSAKSASGPLTMMDQDARANTGPTVLSKQGTSFTLDLTTGLVGHYQYASQQASSIGSASSILDNGCLDHPPMIRLHTASLRTDVEYHSTVGFSVGYELLLTSLLLSDVATLRQGLAVLQLQASEVCQLYSAEQFESLVSELCHKDHIPISRARLCEICAVAAVLGQCVRHLLVPGVINYWYDAAVYLFAECVQISPDSATRTATLLALFESSNSMISCAVLE